MSDRSVAKSNEPIVDSFKVLTASGTPVTGLVHGDFTFRVYDPTDTEVSGTHPVTLTELGYGLYRTEFTPDAVGNWQLEVVHATYFPWGQTGNYEVFNQLFDDITLDNLGIGNRVVKINVRDASTLNPIPAVWIEVYDSTSTTRHAFGYSNSSGYAQFNLFDGDYKVYMSKIGEYIFTVPEDLTVVDGASIPDVEVTYDGTVFTPSTPPTADLCVVYGWEQDAQGNGLAVDVTAQIIGTDNLLSSNPHINQTEITTTSSIAHANGPGYWELALLPSTDYIPGENVYYKFTIDNTDIGSVLVPDLSSVALKTLLDP
jgi:hypothetical protein